MISVYRQHRINNVLNHLYSDYKARNMKGVHDDLDFLTTFWIGFPHKSNGYHLVKTLQSALYKNGYSANAIRSYNTYGFLDINKMIKAITTNTSFRHMNKHLDWTPAI